MTFDTLVYSSGLIAHLLRVFRHHRMRNSLVELPPGIQPCSAASSPPASPLVAGMQVSTATADGTNDKHQLPLMTADDRSSLLMTTFLMAADGR